jgi:restriction system protein
MMLSVVALIFFAVFVLMLRALMKKLRNLKRGKSWSPPWDGKKSQVSWNLTLLNELEWKRFEEVVSEYYTLLGYRSEVTRMGADGGVDVILYQQGVETPAIIVQCKSWSQKVGVKAIRELFGVMAADQIGYGVFATTSSYTQEAIDWADGKRLQLLSGEDLVSAFNQLPEDQRTYLLQFATFEDYSTPTCPSCNKKMVKRTASKGKSAGSSFWGCSHYPRCKQTFKLV